MISAEASAGSGFSITGVICPSSLIAGGNPAEIKRSDAPFCFIIVSSCCTSLTACSRSMFLPVRAASVDGEATRIGRLHACFLDRGHPLLDHFLQALVECLHARSEGLRVGKEGVSPFKYGWSPYT